MVSSPYALENVKQYVSFVVDTALSTDHTIADVDERAVLVGWQCGFEPLFVAVIGATTDTRGRRDRPDADEAVEIARDYLRERKWFSDPDAENEPSYVLSY